MNFLLKNSLSKFLSITIFSKISLPISISNRCYQSIFFIFFWNFLTDIDFFWNFESGLNTPTFGCYFWSRSTLQPCWKGGFPDQILPVVVHWFLEVFGVPARRPIGNQRRRDGGRRWGHILRFLWWPCHSQPPYATHCEGEISECGNL